MATLYEYCNTGDNNHLNCYSGYWVCQSFTPQISHTITLLKIKGWRTNAGHEPIEAEIRSGSPTGSIIGGATFDTNIWAVYPGMNFGSINLSVTPDLIAGTTYYMVFHDDYPYGSQPYIRIDTTGDYPRGQVYFSTNGGSSYYSYPAYDIMFEEWGEPLAVVKPLYTGGLKAAKRMSRLRGF